MTIGHASSPARAAWLASFVITIVVITALLFVKSARAAPLGPLELPILPRAAETLADEEAEEPEAEAEEGDEEVEEEWDDEGEEREECGLRTARASALADESQALVRTQISYTSFEPVRAVIDFRLSGPKGSVTVGRDHKRLSFSGVVHDNERLSKGELAKALAARTITVTVRVLGAPGFCNRYFDRHLKSRRAGGDRISWLQYDSVSGS